MLTLTELDGQTDRKKLCTGQPALYWKKAAEKLDRVLFSASVFFAIFHVCYPACGDFHLVQLYLLQHSEHTEIHWV